jgi:hypothetical protein
MERDALPELKTKEQVKWQKANRKWQMAKVKTKFENRNWKLEIQDAKPERVISPRLIAASFAICLLRFAF